MNIACQSMVNRAKLNRVLNGRAWGGSKMNGLLKVGLAGFAVIASQLVLFYALIRCSLEVSNKSRHILKLLSHSLADFQDSFGDEENIVTKARTRYRRALEEIEKVDTQLITSSMLSYTEVARVFGVRLSYTEFDQFVRSGPSILITLGLLGTFIGLTGNLTELSLILDSAKASPAESLLRASAILGPMATAFISSLVAVSLSLAFWAFATVKGINTVVGDLNELMGAYLDQVIQANSKRFNLMRESLERMELYLTEFLSNFTRRVGESVDKAMRDKISEVFNSLAVSADAQARYVDFLREGSTSLQEAGGSFERASITFSKSSFASTFSDATQQFLVYTTEAGDRSNRLAESASHLEMLLTSLRESCLQGTQYFIEMSDASKTQTEVASSALETGNKTMVILEDATKQLREARLAVGRDARANEELTASIANGLSAVQQNLEKVSSALDANTTRSQEQVASFTANMVSILNEVRILAESIDASTVRLSSNAVIDPSRSPGSPRQE